MLKLTTDGTAVLLKVKVMPGAPHTRYLGEWDGRARIAVAAPPERGKANQALVDFLAKRLRISKRDISMEAGSASPLKTLRIKKTTPATI